MATIVKVRAVLLLAYALEEGSKNKGYFVLTHDDNLGDQGQGCQVTEWSLSLPC